jgi:hypothetical protein
LIFGFSNLEFLLLRLKACLRLPASVLAQAGRRPWQARVRDKKSKFKGQNSKIRN